VKIYKFEMLIQFSKGLSWERSNEIDQMPQVGRKQTKHDKWLFSTGLLASRYVERKNL